MRRLPALACAALLAAASACSRAAPPEPPIEATPHEITPKTEAPPGVAPSADADPQPGARRRAQPEPEAPAKPEAPAEPRAEQPERRTTLGTIHDWVKAYEGMGSPDRHPPPQLGVLSELKALPASELVYVRSGHLVRVELPAGRETPLSTGASRDGNPRWSRDGAWLFFVSNREGGVDRIFRQRFPDGKAEAVSGPVKADDLFEWTSSEDGARVAHVRRGQDSDQGELVVIDAASRGESVVRRGVSIGNLLFTRDGRRLLEVEGGLMDERIVSIDLASGKATELPRLKHDEISELNELPDGRLLFASSRVFSMGDRDPGLYTMPSAGGAWVRHGNVSAPVGYLHPHPSPDGKKLAVHRSLRAGGFGADWHADVALLDAGGRHVRDLAAAYPRPFYSASGGSWAPDSRHLAFNLDLCPYAGCELGMNSVVLADTASPSARLVFVAQGAGASFRPAPGAAGR